MIKLPKDVNQIIKTIESAGLEAYVVGGGVRDSLLGMEPEDWDIATSGTIEELLKLLPQAQVIGEKYGVIRISTEKRQIEVATFRKEGIYSDHRRPDEVVFTHDIKEDLQRRDFTVNAIAGHPDKGLVDPYGGVKDIKARLIRTVGVPATRFEEDPLRILRGIRLAAQLDFDLDMDTFKAMQEKVHLLEHLSADRIRRELERIVTAPNSGKGLRICMTSGAMPYIVGDCYNTASKAEMADLIELAENIDKSRIDKEYRLALLYLCFDRSKAMESIERLHYDKDLEKKLHCGVLYLEDLSFVNQRIDLKQFICKMGQEMYDYLESLAKQQRKVYDFTEYKIRNRMVILENIQECREPIFIGDLAVDGNDLKDLGLEGEEIGKMLQMLLDVVHKKPAENRRDLLLKKAKEFQKNPFIALFRKVRWY